MTQVQYLVQICQLNKYNQVQLNHQLRTLSGIQVNPRYSGESDFWCSVFRSQWTFVSKFFQRQRSSDLEDYEHRPVPPSFSTVPPAPRARYDYDDIRREQEREDELYRRRLLVEQQAAAEQVNIQNLYNLAEIHQALSHFSILAKFFIEKLATAD